MFGQEIIPLTASWQDRVKGSWWKAPLLIIGYFYIRLLLELEVVHRGLAAMNTSLSIESLTDAGDLMSIMAEAELFYHLQAFGTLLIVLLAIKLFGMKLFSFKRVTWRGVLTTFLLFVAFMLLQMLLGLAIETLFPDYTQPDNQEAVARMVQTMHPVGMFLNIVILTPVIEEIICRGLVMKYTFPLMPAIGALVSMLFFTLLHGPANVIDFLIYFVLSVGITFSYWQSRQLEYAILFHILQNLLGFLSIYLVQ